MTNGSRGNAPGGVAICGVAVLTGAVLVFQVQPIAGRFLLPAFGGGAGVWTACMFFFQTMLLAGYAYAHVLTTALAPRGQAALHGALLALSVPFLPLTFAADDAAAGAGDPGALIWLALLGSIGVPFVLLAATAPLLQRWFSLLEPARSPYRLYALSNAGALLALVSYPLFIEPKLALEAQTLAWTSGYGLFVAVSLAACGLVWRRYAAPADGDARAASREGDRGRRPHTVVDTALTVVLSASGVVMLLAVTNQVTQNVAPIPFLWILPLVIFLLTYIVCFSGERTYDRPIWGSLFVVAASSLILLEFFGGSFGIVPVILAYSLMLYCILTVCHGELYRLRPEPARLSLYYLAIAFGGALGGAFVSVIAPLVFDRYWEGLAGVYLVYLVFGFLVLRDNRSAAKPAAAPPLSAAQALLDRWAGRLFAAGWIVGVFLFPAVVIAVHSLLPDYGVQSSRNFYGILNVRDVSDDGPPRRILVDGTTIHGFQLLEEGREGVPTSYYAANTGIGLVMQNIARPASGLRVGVVGLGAGTLAAYGARGDRFRFYELNPAVVDLAKRHFSFLEDSPAASDIVVGDGRVSLERELARPGGRAFDVLVLDAFTSDAIPVHLLTREAHALYWSHLKPGGVLAFHVTNNYLDLSPVVANAASALGKEAVLVTTEVETGVGSTADWVLLTEAEQVPLAEAPEGVVISRLLPPLDEPVWTDDYSDPLGTLRK